MMLRYVVLLTTEKSFRGSSCALRGTALYHRSDAVGQSGAKQEERNIRGCQMFTQN